MNSFDAVWSSLSEKLVAGTIIENWTAFHGYLGDTMTVTRARENYIEVVPPRAKNRQLVPRDDFQKVWEVWIDYKDGKVKRFELRDMTRFSKYIVSILHWYDSSQLTTAR